MEQPASGAAAAKGKSKGKGQVNGGDCVQWTTQGQYSRGDKCGMKQDPENKREPMCAFQHTEGADGEPKKRNNAAVVANTLDITQASKDITSLNSRVKGKVHETHSVYFASQNVVFVSAPLWELYRKVEKLVDIHNVLLIEQLGRCADVIEANMECARKKAWDFHKNMYKVERVKILSTSSRTTQ